MSLTTAVSNITLVVLFKYEIWFCTVEHSAKNTTIYILYMYKQVFSYLMYISGLSHESFKSIHLIHISLTTEPLVRDAFVT